MKLSTLIRWVGPAAIGAGVFMVFSGLSGLPIHVPYLSQNDPNGYQVVDSGLILFALALLLVGMLGLYAGQTKSGGARVLESGAGYTGREDLEVGGEGADLEEPRWLPADRGAPCSRHESAGRGHRASPVSLASSRGQTE